MERDTLSGDLRGDLAAASIAIYEPRHLGSLQVEASDPGRSRIGGARHDLKPQLLLTSRLPQERAEHDQFGWSFADHRIPSRKERQGARAHAEQQWRETRLVGPELVPNPAVVGSGDWLDNAYAAPQV